MAKKRKGARRPDHHMSAVALPKALKKGLAPAYAIVGEEEFLRREAILRIRRAAFGGEEDSPSLSEFDGRKATVGEILDEARTLPFFGGGRRVVIVQHAEVLLEPPKASWSKERAADREREVEAMFSYLDKPLESATLVLCAAKLDRRLKSHKRLEAHDPYVTCNALEGRELHRWVEDLAGDVPFAPGASDALIARSAGGQVGLGQLAAEVAKLQTLARGQSAITADLVEALVSESRSDGLFDLLRTVNQGRLGPALEMAGAMLRDGAIDQSGKRIREPSALIAMAIGSFRWQLNQVWRVHSLIQQGLGSQGIKEKVGYVRGDIFDLARATQHAALEARHRSLRAADSRMKSSAPSVETFIRLVTELTELARKDSLGGGARDRFARRA